MKIKLSTPYGIFLQGGRLTDSHKNNIDTHELLTKLNYIAKEKVEGNNMGFTYNQVSREFTDIVEYLDSEWGHEEVERLKDILRYSLDCVLRVQGIDDRNAIDNYMRNKVNG